MSQTSDTPDIPAVRDTEENFFQRFSRRKHEARRRGTDAAGFETEPSEQSAMVAPTDSDGVSADRDLLTDADMPDIASLDEQSDYTGFLSAKVSESVRRAALRKLFHSTGFNIIDELDDYNEDFTTFEALGDIVTAEMRHRDEIERLHELERESVEQDGGEAIAAGSGEHDDEVQSATVDSSDEPEHRSEHAHAQGGSDISEDNLEGIQDDKPTAAV